MELIKFGIFIIMATVTFFLPKSIILFGTIILCNVAIVIVLMMMSSMFWKLIQELEQRFSPN